MTQSVVQSEIAGKVSSYRVPLVMILVGLASFAAIGADVAFHGKLTQFDLPLARFIFDHAHRPDILFFAAISGLGEVAVILSVAFAFGIFLLYRRRGRELMAWVIGLVGCAVINPALKHYFGVPRPSTYTTFAHLLRSGYTFPSGHTMAVAISAGLIAMILPRFMNLTARQRRLLVAAACGISVLEAFALFYVGVHYLTDVLGALAMSLAWLGVMRVLLPPIKSPSPLEIAPGGL